MNNTLYLAPQHIAERTGRIGSRYRVLNNLFIINYDDIKIIVLGPNETRQSLLDSLTKITESEASRLIAESGGKIGPDKDAVLLVKEISISPSQQEQIVQEVQQEAQEETVVEEEPVEEKVTKKRTKK